MRVRSAIFGSLIIVGLLISTAGIGENLPGPASAGQSNPAATADPLLQLLVSKGVLNSEEARSLRGTPEQQREKLLELLKAKGILSASDYEALSTPSASQQVDRNLVASTTPILPMAITQSATPVAEPPKPAPPAVIAAVSPVRVFPVDAPKTGGLTGLKVGPLTLAPYGFVKATVVHDSSDPDGDDFPFPGIWLNSGNILSTGPTQDPEVHVKARSTRFGLNLEWPDISKNLTLTGKIEGDLEGNFSEVDNRDVSSIRSNMPQLRLAYVRMDYHAGENTDIFFVGGQDWTLFGSGALMNIVETTFNGAYWGNIYTRSPQLRGGFIQTLSKENHVNLEGQLGIMMPSSGQILKLGSLGLAGQLGQGEREGADSDRPEWESRVALSYQLDKARGVAPAQIALAGFRGSRTSIAYNQSAVGPSEPYAEMCATTNYCSTFPNGFQASSHMYGGQIVVQVPTRWFTLVATAYRGGDLRFYFGGQINSFATDVGGLDPLSLEGPMPTLDGGPLAATGGAVLGCPLGSFTPGEEGGGTCSVNPVVAPQRPIRSFGGFAQLGLPLSRWFNANPHGHNAGWQLQFTLGKDQVVDRDLNNPGFVAAYNGAGTAPLPLLMGKSAIGTLYYKVNNWATFAFEQSIYATRGLDHADIYTIAGNPSNEWQDHRTEFGPIFTF
ncbi:MAG: hypothetical protein WB817_10355 [Terriglobales bacterium]